MHLFMHKIPPEGTEGIDNVGCHQRGQLSSRGWNEWETFYYTEKLWNLLNI